jgi:hypothetical protein
MKDMLRKKHVQRKAPIQQAFRLPRRDIRYPPRAVPSTPPKYDSKIQRPNTEFDIF